MIYKFICRYHYPIRAEIYMSADDEETAMKEFNKINYNTFDWKDDPIRREFTTLEIIDDKKS